MADGERARQGKMSQLVTSTSTTQDALTRLWTRADSSHGHHLEAVAELRERKRREQDLKRQGRLRYRKRRRGASGPSVPTAQQPGVPVAEGRARCERCKRTVEQASSDWVAIASPMAEPVQHLFCSRCADEVRRGLLRLLAGQEPLPAPVPEAHAEPLSIPARAGRFAFRLAAYGLIGLVVFTLVTWLVLR